MVVYLVNATLSIHPWGHKRVRYNWATKQQHSLKIYSVKKKKFTQFKKKIVLRLKNGKGAGRLLKELKSIPNCFLILEMGVLRMDRRGRLEKQDIVEIKDSQGTHLGTLMAHGC